MLNEKLMRKTVLVLLLFSNMLTAIGLSSPNSANGSDRLDSFVFSSLNEHGPIIITNVSDPDLSEFQDKISILIITIIFMSTTFVALRRNIRKKF